MSLQGWTSTPFSSQGPRAHPCTAGAPLPHRQLTRWAWSGPGAALGTKVAWRTEVSCDPISGVWDSCCLSAMEPCPARPRHSHQTRQEAVRACRREGKTGSPVMGRGEIGDPPPTPASKYVLQSTAKASPSKPGLSSALPGQRGCGLIWLWWGMSLSPYLAHRVCSLTAGHPLSVACRCLWGRGTQKQKMWTQGSNGLQDTPSPLQRRCLLGRRNYRKDKWGGGGSQVSVAPPA